MNNFREVNDNDISSDWISIREQESIGVLNSNDEKHSLYYDELFDKILNSIPKRNRQYVQKQLDEIDNNFTDYLVYWTEKYYRNGFVSVPEFSINFFVLKYVNAVLTLLSIFSIVSFSIGYIYSLISLLLFPFPFDKLI